MQGQKADARSATILHIPRCRNRRLDCPRYVLLISQLILENLCAGLLLRDKEESRSLAVARQVSMIHDSNNDLLCRYYKYIGQNNCSTAAGECQYARKSGIPRRYAAIYRQRKYLKTHTFMRAPTCSTSYQISRSGGRSPLCRPLLFFRQRSFRALP